MLGVEDAMKSAIFKRTVCPNGFSKTMGEGLHAILIATIITEEEAVAETKGIRDEVR